MANERVLVIEDSVEHNQFVVDYVLKPNEYQALVAYDGQEGLNIALSEHPDLILLDMNLPKLNGLEVLDALNEQAINIPVIVMTFHGSEKLAVQVFRLGVKDYVLKPFKVAELLDAIERALMEVRLRKERDELTERLLASNQALEQRIRELNTLFGIGKSVTAWQSQEWLLSRLVEAAVYLTKAEESALLLVDPKTNELYVPAARGIDDRVVHLIRLKVEETVSGQVITTGQPMILGDEAQLMSDLGYPVSASMYVPLKVRDRVLGVLNVNNRQTGRDFDNHDLSLLSTLADYTSISLENDHLLQQAESEQTKLSTVLNRIQEAVFVIDDETEQVILVNNAFRSTFGLDDVRSDGYDVRELIDNTPLTKFIGQAALDEEYRGEITLDDGRIFTAIITPILGFGRAVILQNVTHFRSIDQIKTNFIANLSHDLRSPLISLKGYTDMLNMVGPLNEKQTIFAKRIGSGIDKIIALVDDLVDLSKIDAGIELDATVVNVNQLAVEVVSELQERAGRKRQQLVYHAPSQPAFVVSDPLRLRQVLVNLVDNALKYTPENGQISTLVQVSDSQVLFKIEDNGLGIPANDLPFVFDKFFRVENEDRYEIPGIGLGLAFCRSVIEKSGGTIWVESDFQKGSTFTFTLNAAPANAPDLNNTSALDSTIVPTQ
ncbi:MAG: ATP-binding protein [Anaerolineae bacterium]|nr:ATP-binding protein [Anaerolineae bacterium]